MAEACSPAKGTRPPGTQSEADAARKVREMFTRLAPRYDLLNHLLSLHLDRLWRTRAALRLRPVLLQPDAVVLDLCCGTGDLAFALARTAHARILGADFSHTMLVRANQKAEKAGNDSSFSDKAQVAFLEADALLLPFADSTFDLVTAAFGFRNLANYQDGLREIHRVLKPRGTFAILEFAEPRPGFLGNLYRWYFRTVLPRIGGLISGDRSAYAYLPESVSRFFQPAELSSAMAKAGYEFVAYERWTVGAVAFHQGIKGMNL